MNPIEFLEQYFVLESTGKPIVLETWQIDFLDELFREDKQYSLAVLSATKKTGKSTLCAGIGLYILFCWPSPAEVLFVANSKEQTKTLSYKTLAWACENQPELARSTTVYKDRVEINSTGAIARCLPTKAKSAAGASPSLVIFDEAWGLTSEDEDLWSELTSIPTKRSLTLVASYAGLSKQSPLLQRLYELGMSEHKPDDMLFFWSHDPKLSSWVTDEYLKSQQQKLLPHQFQRLFGNVWGSSAGAYIPSDMWQDCYNADLKPLPPRSKELISLGLDAGVKKDSTALIGVFLEGDTVKLAHTKFWIPSRGKEVDLESVYNYLVHIANDYNIVGCWYDPKYLTSIAQRITATGAMKMTEVSPSAMSMSPVFEGLYQLCKSGRFKHYDDETLTQHIMNSVAEDNIYGIMLNKIKRTNKIDGAVALSLACKEINRILPEFKIYHIENIPVASSPLNRNWRKSRPQSWGDMIKRARL